MAYSEACDFLRVKPGDYVVIRDERRSKSAQSYWIGRVISCIGGARNATSWTLFQVINIDNGEIIIINADIVERILKSSES